MAQKNVFSWLWSVLVDAVRGTPSNSPKKTHHVYVIELDRAVLKEPKFVRSNPGYDPRKACLYVGMTGLNPDERLRQHKAGHKANRYVRKYGLSLRRSLYETLNPLTYEEAKSIEKRLADDLRAQGHAVWQN